MLHCIILRRRSRTLILVVSVAVSFLQKTLELSCRISFLQLWLSSGLLHRSSSASVGCDAETGSGVVVGDDHFRSRRPPPQCLTSWRCLVRPAMLT